MNYCASTAVSRVPPLPEQECSASPRISPSLKKESTTSTQISPSLRKRHPPLRRQQKRAPLYGRENPAATKIPSTRKGPQQQEASPPDRRKVSRRQGSAQPFSEKIICSTKNQHPSEEGKSHGNTDKAPREMISPPVAAKSAPL
jgi:hypothetical protein